MSDTQRITREALVRKVADDLRDRALKIELLLMDVDGVLTDGRVTYTSAGDEIKRFHIRDGSGLKIWRGLGLRAAVISGRSSPAVDRRMAELDVSPVIQGRPEKAAAFYELLAATGLTADKICAVGDDLPDLPIMLRSGLCVAVADACAEVRACAAYTTVEAGGRGAVRETIEWLLKLRGQWTAAVESFRV